MRKMYLENAIERINKVNWTVIGTEGIREDAKLMAEFLRRMAAFSLSYDVTLQNPFVIDIAEELGFQNNIDTEKLCSKETLEYVNNNMYANCLIKSYLKLSAISDENKEVQKYLDIYDPIIRLFEKGVNFIVRSGFIDVTNVGSFPVSNWLSRSQNEPIDVNNI
ncbi:hypothetical protein [Paenibacillus hubeiensis]|uniref:hypothetical protein n=1 Tax=Paenibacillus hubeiensis TaxID=3077330 RepID=UPI0031BABB79